ncbi:Phage portal protein, lambda family [Thalassoglobus neptunius]|uniref:Phage portal protein, lambda family n=1 Tax=Thalassoglobus neptunius TaxID=1938619 RepID=A0A5C5WDP0_9PLAN|nr:phage portal protein [Thalassoglobus neptunius]TWT49028.1 Phage portal protein, lambda family [Thalassoglobus neptunius]
MNLFRRLQAAVQAFRFAGQSKTAARSPRSDSDPFWMFPWGSSGRGGYRGGQLDRMSADWRPGTIGPNRMFAMDGKLLRERAWDLYLNNPWAKSAVESYVANVIECGIIPHRNHLENGEDWSKAWDRWGGLTAHSTREADLTGEQTIYGLQQTWLREILVGGGCLIHFVDRPRRSQRIPISLELIPEERFADHLQTVPGNPKTANRIHQGHEIDPATGRTVAYHVLKSHPNDLTHDPLATVRLARETCEYGYMKERTGQKRGTTLLKQALRWIWSLGYITDNELDASTLKSQWAYMITTATPSNDDNGVQSQDGYLTDLAGNKIDEHQSGMIWHGSPEDEIKGTGPNVPGGDAVTWVTLIQESIAIGANLSWQELTRNYGKANFSAARMTRGGDKKRFRPMQDFSICHFGNPTVERFDRAAVGALTPGFPSPTQYLQERDELLDAQDWQAPGWESPNPKDDATANHQRIADKLVSRTEIAGTEGRSWKKSRKLLESEQRELEDSGLAATAEPAPSSAPEETPEDSPEQQETE